MSLGAPLPIAACRVLILAKLPLRARLQHYWVVFNRLQSVDSLPSLVLLLPTFLT